MNPRIEALKTAVMSAAPGVCPERALSWTRYHKVRKNRKKPAPVRMAEALSAVLAERTIAIWPHELIVGNYTSRRVGGAVFPELHGLVQLADLFTFPTRAENPLEISRAEQLKLAAIVPFWATRFLGAKVHSSRARNLAFMARQIKGHEYVINETGGISHVAPDYEKLLQVGAYGIAEEARALQKGVRPGSEAAHFYRGVARVMEGLAAFGHRYADLAADMAKKETDPARRAELFAISEVCGQVPARSARTFWEALQSVFFAQVAINAESLDNSVCPGRMDQYLYPYYERDVEAGILTREAAKELVFCFSIKMAEIIPVFSGLITRFHGGLFNGQVVNVGGV
ncbi:MAG: formate acetyltransferase, partial [Deltaproteobacteria bacterium]|nr:formate acetyltransferase [Deltaproteobacteria bacterium]